MSAKFKTKLKKEFVESLFSIIEKILQQYAHDCTDDDNMLRALFVEIWDKLYRKQGDVKKEYAISFTPAQAFALRILYTDFINENNSYTGNKLHLISNEIHKQFSY